MSFVLVAICSTIFLYDLLYRRVPNWIILIGLSIHLGALLAIGYGWRGIDVQQSLMGCLIGLALFVPLYALRAMGAGDVKFFALLGAMMGPQQLVPLWLIGSGLAGMHALVWYACRQNFIPAFTGWHRWTARINDSTWMQSMMRKRAGRKGIPYAAYLAAGAIAIITTG